MLFQYLGEKSTKKVKSSSLPAIMSIAKTNVEKSENPLKFIDGPTALNPGPTLLIHVNAAEKLVTRSYPSNDIKSVPANITAIYINIKFIIFVTTDCCTGILLIVMFITIFGCSF